MKLAWTLQVLLQLMNYIRRAVFMKINPEINSQGRKGFSCCKICKAKIKVS